LLLDALDIFFVLLSRGWLSAHLWPVEESTRAGFLCVVAREQCGAIIIEFPITRTGIDVANTVVAVVFILGIIVVVILRLLYIGGIGPSATTWLVVRIPISASNIGAGTGSSGAWRGAIAVAVGRSGLDGRYQVIILAFE
jgi:hypothetical protein